MKAIKVLVITSWSYKDALIHSSTLPYLKMINNNLPEGSIIYLVTFDQENFKILPSEKEKIKIELSKNRIRLISLPYKRLGLLSLPRYFLQALYVLGVALFKRVNVVHAFCPPAGVLGYVVALIVNAKLVLDSYEPHAESMVESGIWKNGGIKHRFLFEMEKRMSMRANAFISATEGMRDYAVKKYNVLLKEFYVRPTCVDMDLFSIQKSKNQKLIETLSLQDKIVCLYAGKFGSVYLEQETIDFVKECHLFWGDKFVFLLLTAHSENEVKELFKKYDANYHVVRQFFVAHNHMPEYMGLADFAITPVKPVPSKRYCSPIKDGEYWAMGLPIVIPEGISDDSNIVLNNDSGYVLKKLNKQEYHQAVLYIDHFLKTNNPELTRTKIRSLANQYRGYAIAEKVYSTVYQKLSINPL